jgi:CTP synthase
MQMAVIEYARNVCGMTGANSTEVDPDTEFPVIDLMLEQRDLSDLGGTMRLGAYPCVIADGTVASRVYAKKNVSERHRHRYEFNTKYRSRIEQAGMVLSGLSPDGSLVEMVEIPDHPWFLASQFHPEFKSRPLDCHPILKGYIKAVLVEQRRRRSTPPLAGLRVVSRSEGSS